MENLLNFASAPDSPSRRHHYVPKTYLKAWSFDGKRVWALNTSSGDVKALGLRDVCVEENFNRVIGPDGVPHNRVELMFGAVDTELSRVQRLFSSLENPEDLEFDDLIGLGSTIAVQRMRTQQIRRLRQQHNAWLVAQNPNDFQSLEDTEDAPFQVSGFHTELLFNAMWDAADVMTSRQIEIWEDPQGRFMTSDAPVIVPFRRNKRPDLYSAPYIIWPVSPYRVVALSNDAVGEKAILKTASGKQIGLCAKVSSRGAKA